jgi:hypothetical protein
MRRMAGAPDDQALGRPALALPLLLGLGTAKLLLHLALSTRYGYFRDELYFLDCGRHLDWGYVDHAPLVGLMARLALALGGSLPVLRAFPALAGALLVFLTGALAWRLGGGRLAQGLAALGVLVMPIRLAIDGLFGMNSLEPLFWTGAAYLLVRIVQTGDGRRWPWLGLLLGAGLMNKHSTLFFAVALGAGILLTPLRRDLRGRWPWLGVALALAAFAPNLLWQVRHDFATLEDLRSVARTGKNVVLGPVPFVLQQVLITHPVLVPVWVAGVVRLFRGEGGRYRALGWTYVVFFVLMFALKAKNYYLAPVYPMLLAAGGVATEAGLARWRWSRERWWPRWATVTLVLGAGAVTAPLAMPLFSPERYLGYEAALGVARSKTEVAHEGPLPQHLSDQFGWPELAAEVARIYHALPPADRARAAIFAGNYGEAGAVNHFGPRLGLPRAISGHQTHFFWGPRGATGEVVIVLQGTRSRLEERCASVEEAGRHFHPWGMAEENRPIFVCRGLKTPLAELWPRLKHWN